MIQPRAPSVYLTTMKLFAVIALALAGSLLPPDQHVAASVGHTPELSARDRRTALMASRLTRPNLGHASTWLSRQGSVESARLGTDGRTIEVRFRDGGRIAIVPPIRSSNRAVASARRTTSSKQFVPAAGGSSRALVLEPFADLLGRGDRAGEAEVDALKRGGFSVDIARNGGVSVSSLQNMSSYGVVYMETHAGALPNGDAIVLTRETDTRPYTSLFADGSLLQALVAGDPTGTIYIAITGTFLTRHVTNFPEHSLVFLNGCGVLSDPAFWNALRARNVATLIGWDQEVDSSVTDDAGALVLDGMARGADVATEIAAAHAAGVGDSFIDATPASLGYLGDGRTSFPTVLGTVQSAPVVSPTPVPSYAPSPAPAIPESWRRYWGGCARMGGGRTTTCWPPPVSRPGK